MDTLKLDDCLQASTNVKNFIEKNNQLPNYVTIAGKNYSMEQYMYISSNLLLAIRVAGSKSVASVINKVKVDKPKITPIKANIDKKTFFEMNEKVYQFFMKNNKAPSQVASKYGNVQYQAYIYSNSKILNYYRVHKSIPDYVSLNLAKNSKILTYLPKH